MWNTRKNGTLENMSKARKWNRTQLKKAVSESYSVREVIKKLGLIPAGGNYQQIQAAINDNGIDISHFTGKGWRKNRTFEYKPKQKLDTLLVKGSTVQGNKLKHRLFRSNLKVEKCELCGWAERSKDGRIPVELDHINGDRFDNRLSNLRILCPNCHSLQTTHRGMNQGRLK